MSLGGRVRTVSEALLQMNQLPIIIIRRLLKISLRKCHREDAVIL